MAVNITEFSGLSFLVEPVFPVANFSGLSFESLSNVFVKTFELGTNDPLEVDITIENVDFPADDFSNGTAGFESHEHRYYVGNSSVIKIIINKAGYQPKEQPFAINAANYYNLEVFLEPIVAVMIDCTTTFKNAFGSTVSKPLRDGYVEVEFEFNTAVDPSDWSVLFEGLPVGGEKFTSEVLGFEPPVISGNSLIYKVDVVQKNGDYYYLSNIVEII